MHSEQYANVHRGDEEFKNTITSKKQMFLNPICLNIIRQNVYEQNI